VRHKYNFKDIPQKKWKHSFFLSKQVPDCTTSMYIVQYTYIAYITS